jgi:hypothetical protein
MINNELTRIWEEAVETYLKELNRHSSGIPEESY